VGQLIDDDHATQIESQAALPVPVLQLIAGADPSGGADVRSFSALAPNIEDLLFERGIDLSHETIRFWWNRFGPMLAGEVRPRRVGYMRGFRHWRWHLDEVFVKINGETHYPWPAVDHEGEVLESYVTKTRALSEQIARPARRC
jgi:hypothetical protein